MPDATVNSSLSTIWSLFNRAGITDTFDIIEYLAALLTEGQPPPSEDVRPRMPPSRPGLDIDSIKRHLQEAALAAQSKATLFDRYVIFRLGDRLPDRGGHYPTPRHIVQFMRRIIQIETHHRLADFACGTGGFLVAREPNEPQASEVVGIDNSPEWAHLAWANTSLHSDARATILVGDPLRICGAQGSLAGERFDRVLMNPPFGAPIDADLARATIGHETGGNSETALAALAIHVLAEEGRAGMLVPTGLLFGKNTGERGLQERLVGSPDAQGNVVGSYQLKAVISLPKDALQPYGSLQTHLLLAQKHKAEQSTQERRATWFFQAESDGYRSGRRRDITMPPVVPNDLTFVETVLLAHGNYSGEDRIFSVGNRPFIGVRRVLAGEAFLGVVIEALHGAPLSRITYFPEKEGITPPFFVTAATDPDDTQKQLSVSVVVDQNLLTDTDSDEKILLNRLYQGIPEKNRPVPEILLQEQEHGQALAIAAGNRILGQAVFADGIVAHDYDLQPKEYVKTIGGTGAVEPSAVLLGRVRRAQSTFLEQIDGLLGRLELTPIAGLQLPSKTRDDIRPFTRLAQGQEQFWQRICAMSEQRRDTLNGLFTLEDVSSPETLETARLTLELFERMGVIVSVTLVDPNTREALPTVLYRRVSERDLWK